MTLIKTINIISGIVLLISLVIIVFIPTPGERGMIKVLLIPVFIISILIYFISLRKIKRMNKKLKP